MHENESSYTKHWREYKRSTWVASLWLVLGFPLVIGVAMLLKIVLGEAALVGLVLLVVLWAAAWAWLCVRVTRFRCPRCNSLYFAHTQLYIGAGRQCANCGLALYSAEAKQ
jgi:hypothetical protein